MGEVARGGRGKSRWVDGTKFLERFAKVVCGVWSVAAVVACAIPGVTVCRFVGDKGDRYCE